MTEPEFATDVRDDLMHLTLDANETDAIVVLMADGNHFSRLSSDIDPAEAARRLREVADEVEQGP